MKKLTLLGCALVLTACQPKAGMDSKTSASATTSSVTSQAPAPNPTAPPEATGDPTTIAVLPTTMGARNFDQINATMETVTGVSGNSNVISRFKMLSTQLPADNDIKSFSFSGQGAVTVLAAEYCTALIQNTNNRYATQLAAAIGNFNLALAPSVAFAGTNPTTLAQSLVMKFWGSSYANNANAATAIQNVANLLKTLPVGQTDNATTTKNSVIGACTSVLASAPVSTY